MQIPGLLSGNLNMTVSCFVTVLYPVSNPPLGVVILLRDVRSIANVEELVL